MATATHIPPAALAETFKRDLFSKELEGWVGRATPEDRERFERLFNDIRTLSESQKVVDADAEFISKTINKIKSASTGTAGTSSSHSGRPALYLTPGAGSVTGNGWAYTATRAALRKPEVASTMVKLQDKAAAENAAETKRRQEDEAAQAVAMGAPPPQVAGPPRAGRPNSAGDTVASARDTEPLKQAGARRRAISFGAGPPEGGRTGPVDAVDMAAAKAQAVIDAIAAGHPIGPFSSLGQPPQPPKDQPLAERFQDKAPYSTNYADSYNLRSMYPDIYDQALRDTKADPVPNYTLLSAWGDSLKSGSRDAAKLYYKTTYNRVNDEVVQFRTGTDAVKEREFFKWMLRQKTYFGDLLTKAKAANLESIFEVADEEQKRDILQALRQAHAVADPDQVRSHSQSVHTEMKSIQDPELEAQLKETTKYRTMGGAHTEMALRFQRAAKQGKLKQRPSTATELRPSKVELSFSADMSSGRPGTPGGGKRPFNPNRRPATAGGALLGNRVPPEAANAIPPPTRAFVTSGTEKDTFRSKVPLQWATTTVGPKMSTYLDHFGGAKYATGRERPNSALFKTQPVVYREVTCPIGAVNPHTAMAPERAAYPVPEGFLGKTYTYGKFPQDQADTTYRVEFAPRDAGDVAAKLGRQATLATIGRNTLLRGTIPLGPRNGCNLVPPADWISEMKDEYVPYDADPRGQYEQAQRVKAMFCGPTASVGKVATTMDRIPGADSRRRAREASARLSATQ
ncbi:hypothetical protein HYH03_013166 [Edaphochlamys debaryana]|uniref:Uncharacterized protein n=1 Tax=Edaphochlamys debaryana TaxID=47281 RepID=A0A835XU55_9CHLO|nr:hypothetical protein HYH03_013166 [Edaphochlamys debaryana]|eukprot:KAG2488316.1 hypothetical protein HYH03_013166 [Edaphochlamys debaryana]